MEHRDWAGLTRPILDRLVVAYDAGQPVDVVELADDVGVPVRQVQAELAALAAATCVELAGDDEAGMVRVARVGPLALQLLGREPVLVPHARRPVGLTGGVPRR